MSEDNFQKVLKTVEESIQKQTTEKSEKKAFDERQKELQLSGQQIRQDLTKSFGIWSKWTVSLWLVFISVVISAVGLEWLYYSNGVLITLLTTTTINVLALSLVIIKGLFHQREQSKSKIED